MTSFLRVSDRRGTGGRGQAPRPRRPAAAETAIIGAAEGRHIGRPAPRGKCGEVRGQSMPGPRPSRKRRQGLSTSFPCCPRLGRAEAGAGPLGARRHWGLLAAPDRPPLHPKRAELADHRRTRRGFNPRLGLSRCALQPSARVGWRLETPVRLTTDGGGSSNASSGDGITLSHRSINWP